MKVSTKTELVLAAIRILIDVYRKFRERRKR